MIQPGWTSGRVKVLARIFSPLRFSMIFSKGLPSKFTMLPSGRMVRARTPWMSLESLKNGISTLAWSVPSWVKIFDAQVFVDGGAVSARVFLVHGAFAVQDHGVGAGVGGVVFQGEVGGRDGEPIVAGGGPARHDGNGAKQKGRECSNANESLG